MPMNDNAQSFAHWSNYWAGGALTSLPDDFRENYDGEVAEFWSTQFDLLPERAEIVDVCTGNGAVALLAAQWALDHDREDWRIAAVDAAHIDPAVIGRHWPGQAQALARIRFIPDTPLETLVLPDAGVDLITSQYGLEYCELARAVPRLAATLKSGGRLAMLAHAMSSAMVETMEAERRDYAVIQSLGFLQLLRRWSSGLLDAAAIRSGLQMTGRALSRDQEARSPLVAQVLQACRTLIPLSPGQLLAQKKNAGLYLEQLRAGHMRSEDMLRVNRQIGCGDEWLEVFASAGLDLLESRDLRYRGDHHVGTARVWRKA